MRVILRQQVASRLAAILVEQLPADEYLNVAWVTAELLESGFVYAAELEFALDLILDAIDRVRAEA